MKLPDKAEKKFDGIIFNVYQWEQEMFDGSVATFEMIKRPNTLQIIPILSNGKILIGYEEQPTKKPGYTLLGGRQEVGEDQEGGAKREFLEETGMTADIWELDKSFMPYSKMDWTIYRYIARGCKIIQDPDHEPGEKIELKEVDWDEFIDIATSPGFWCKGLSLDIFGMMKGGGLEEWKRKVLGE